MLTRGTGAAAHRDPAAVTVLVGGTEGEGLDEAEGAERVVPPWGASVPRASTRRLPPGWFLLLALLSPARSIRLGSARGCWLRGLLVLQDEQGSWHGIGQGTGGTVLLTGRCRLVWQTETSGLTRRSPAAH